MTYELIGIRHDYTPNSYAGGCDEVIQREILATFDTQLHAEEYVKKSKLKKPRGSIWSSPLNFKSKSLLGNYSYAEIEEHRDQAIPHSPVLS